MYGFGGIKLEEVLDIVQCSAVHSAMWTIRAISADIAGAPAAGVLLLTSLEQQITKIYIFDFFNLKVGSAYFVLCRPTLKKTILFNISSKSTLEPKMARVSFSIICLELDLV